MVKANPLKLGIFVTLAFAVFIYTLLRVSDGLDFFGSTVTTYVDFKDVKGLRAGNNVRFAGIGIGEVKAITIENDTTLRVQLELDAEVTNFLRKNAVVDIATDGLVGNMIVSMQPGVGEAAFIEPGDVLTSQPKTEITGMLAELAQTNEKIAEITDNLLDISEKMNAGQGTMGLLLNDRSLAMNLLETSKSLRESARGFHHTSQQFNQLLAGVARGEGNLGYLLQSDGMEEEVGRLGDNLDTLLRVRTEAIFKDLALTSTALRSSSRQLEVLMGELTEEKGIINTLVTDTTAAEHLKSTLENLDQGTEKLVDNMEALKHNWFFRDTSNARLSWNGKTHLKHSGNSAGGLHGYTSMAPVASTGSATGQLSSHRRAKRDGDYKT